MISLLADMVNVTSVPIQRLSLGFVGAGFYTGALAVPGWGPGAGLHLSADAPRHTLSVL